MKEILIRILLLLFLCLFVTVFLPADDLTTGIIPSFHMLFPTGEWANNNLSTIGLGADIAGYFALNNIRNFSVSLELGYLAIPTKANLSGMSSDALLSIINFCPGFRGDYPIGDRLTLFGQGHFSGFYGVLTGAVSQKAPGYSWGLGGGLSFIISNRLQFQAGVSYHSFPDFFNAIEVKMGLMTRLSGSGSTAIPREDYIPPRYGNLPGGGYIEFKEARLDRVYPVLYKYYENHPIGSANLVNKSQKIIDDIEIKLILTEYMGTPMLSAQIESLGPGEVKEIDIYALFTEDILSITEGAKLSSELKAEYRVEGTLNNDSISLTLNTYDRNTIEWNDDRKIAAFITARDEEIQKYARNIASMVRDNSLDGFSTEFQLAMVMLSAIDMTGCTYVVDPSSSYLELSKEAAVDSVQFPRQTLQFRGGDCDDMTVTYNALLEALGVETGFITVPGHIYSAFKLEMSPDEVRRTFSRFEDTIIFDDTVWIPVETTALTKGFLNAWRLGARQWKEHSSGGNAVLYPTHDAWAVYEPVAFSVSKYELSVPDREDVATMFDYELAEFIDQEISVRERVLLARLEKNPDDNRSRNSLGVLYAKYGRNDEALAQFEQASLRGSTSATINLGNLAYLDENYQHALNLFKQALELKPESSAALLGVARTAHSLNDFEKAKSEYAKLAVKSPAMAERFSYLADGSAGIIRASDIVRLGKDVIWEEE